jgi:putative transposase
VEIQHPSRLWLHFHSGNATPSYDRKINSRSREFVSHTYDYRFALAPTDEHRHRLAWTLDVVRQVYNHGLHRFNRIPESAGTVAERVRLIRGELPELKDSWEELTDVYSKVLQTAIERIQTNVENLGKLRAKGYDVGSLNWKGTREFRSFTYNQRGFELDEKSGSAGWGELHLSKIGDVPVRLHRSLPDEGDVKQVTLKRDATGEWFACVSVDHDTPAKPDPAAIDPDDCVGIDLGVINYVHDSDGVSVGRLDLSGNRKRLAREQRSFARKEHRSNNWERQRRAVARVHARMTRRKDDLKHKLAHYYTTEYDAVFLEDLDVRGMLEAPGNARNKTEVGWRDLIAVFKHHGEKNGCHVETVPAAGTTKECNECGVEVAKPLWVREHSCPTCGFETDRDHNAALNVLERGLDELGVVHSEVTPSESRSDSAVRTRASLSSTPEETGAAVSTDDGSAEVDASTVVETGSRALKDARSVRAE